MATGSQAVEGRPDAQRPRPKQREKVLVVMHSDSWVEVFAEDHIDVRIAQRLHAGNDASVNQVDEYLELSLPQCYRRLYLPVNLRAFDQCRKQTPEGEIERRQMLDTLKVLREVGQHG